MPAIDEFYNQPNSLLVAGRKIRQVNTDGNQLLKVPKAFYVTVSGNLHFAPVDGYEDATGALIGADITLAVTVGQIIDWIRINKIYADSTATVLAIL